MMRVIAELRMIVRRGPRRRLFKSLQHDDLPGIAAEMAFFAFFSLFPFLLFVAAVAGLLIREPAVALSSLFSLLHHFVPSGTAAVLAQLLDGPMRANRPHLISLGILAILWSGSQGFATVLKALNRVYCSRTPRSWIHQRALSLAVMAVAAVAGVAALLITTALDPGGFISSHLTLSPELSMVWSWLRWPCLFAIGCLLLSRIYHTVPCAGRTHRLVTPGSLVASLIWVGSSMALAAYMNRVNTYGQMYGAIGDVVILMLWMYLGALVLLVGAEIDAAIVLTRRRAGARVAGLPAPVALPTRAQQRALNAQES